MAAPDPIEPEGLSRRRRRWLRRLTWVVVGLGILMAWAVAMLPWVLGTESARRWMLSRADATLVPARLDVASFRFSWFGGTRMTGFTIIDAEGEPVVRSRVAEWDRNLFQILFDRPHYGSLTLNEAALDVERAADGRVDLYEALKPVLNGPPETSLTVVARGRLRLSSPGLERPIEGRALALEIHRPSAPEAVSWSLELGEPVDSIVEKSKPILRSRGSYDRWRPKREGHHDLVFSVGGEDWPLWLEAEGVQARGVWTGQIAPTMRSGLWHFEGKGDLAALDLRGPRLQGDHLNLDRLRSVWSVSETPEGWRLEALDATTELGHVKTIADPSGSSWKALEGRLDVAEAVRRLPHLIPIDDSVVLDGGRLRFRLARPEIGGNLAWNFSGSVAELSIRQGEAALALAEPAEVEVSLVDGANSNGVSRVSAQVRVPQVVWSGEEESTQVGPLAFEVEAGYQDMKTALELVRLMLRAPGAVCWRPAA